VNFKKHKKRRRQEERREAKTIIFDVMVFFVFFDGRGTSFDETDTDGERGIPYKISLSHILFASERDL